MGLDGAWSFKAGHDPFVPLTLARTTTERITLGTAIAVVEASDFYNHTLMPPFSSPEAVRWSMGRLGSVC